MIKKVVVCDMCGREFEENPEKVRIEFIKAERSRNLG